MQDIERYSRARDSGRVVLMVDKREAQTMQILTPSAIYTICLLIAAGRYTASTMDRASFAVVTCKRSIATSYKAADTMLIAPVANIAVRVFIAS